MDSQKTFADITEGDTAHFDAVVSKEVVDAFAQLSGDHNPLHMDAEYAAETPFGERIAHGMIIGAFFSRLVGMHLPGKYCVYLSQSLQFRKPIPLGSMLKIEGVVLAKTESFKTITIKTTAVDSTGAVYVLGEALVKLLK